MLSTIALICAALMFLALLPFPIGYYTFLRIAVTVGALLVMHHYWKVCGINIWMVLFGMLAILFNPLAPVYLGDRSLWVPFNMAGGVLFIVAALHIHRMERDTGKK